MKKKSVIASVNDLLSESQSGNIWLERVNTRKAEKDSVFFAQD